MTLRETEPADRGAVATVAEIDAAGPAAAGPESPRTADAPGTVAAHAGVRSIIGLRRRSSVTVSGAAVLLLIAAPFLCSRYTISTLTQALAFAVLCLSLHVLLGWTGMWSLGQAGYFGVGAYTVGLVAVHHTASAPVLLLCGAAAGAVSAALTGWLLLRSAGGYLLMITLAIGELFAQAAQSWRTLTGGDNGLAAIPVTRVGGSALRDVRPLYFYAMVVLLVCMAAAHMIGRSPFGRALRGIRDNEPRMRSLGYSTYLYKYAAFCIAGAFAGVAGAVWVAHNQFVSPHDLGLYPSAMVLVAVVVGGSASLWGPVLGAVIIIVSQEMLPRSLEGRGPLVLGLLLIAVVYLLPGGLSVLPARLRKAWARRS